jgi:hypothetical protein
MRYPSGVFVTTGLASQRRCRRASPTLRVLFGSMDKREWPRPPACWPWQCHLYVVGIPVNKTAFPAAGPRPFWQRGHHREILHRASGWSADRFAGGLRQWINRHPSAAAPRWCRRRGGLPESGGSRPAPARPDPVRPAQAGRGGNQDNALLTRNRTNGPASGAPRRACPVPGGSRRPPAAGRCTCPPDMTQPSAFSDMTDASANALRARLDLGSGLPAAHRYRLGCITRSSRQSKPG